MNILSHNITIKILFVLFIFSGIQLNAQNDIRGRIVDESNYPLEGAAVSSENQSVLTDINGNFSIPHASKLKVEKAGYKTVIIEKLQDPIYVIVEKDPIWQDLFIPYGKEKYASSLSSSSTIQGSILSDQFVSNIGTVLSGKLPGLTVMNNNGEPFNDTPNSYVIRGLGSFNGSAPKIYVDGFEATLDHLNPMEIKTISIFKDAGSLAQLGIIGGNGVIWVTTKRGEKGKRVSVNINRGLQEMTEKPRVTNSFQYASLYNEALSNDRGSWTEYYSQEQLDAYKIGITGSTEYQDLLYPNVNWYDEVLKQFAPATNANVSFSGGDDDVQYYLMVGYQNIDGLYDHTDPDRNLNSNINSQKFNYRANINARLNEVFSLTTKVGGNISDRFTPSYSTTTLWNNMMNYPANAFPVETPMGYGGTAIYNDNPKASILETGFAHYHYRNIQATFSLQEDLSFITKGLAFSQTLSIFNNQSQTYRKSKDYQRFAPYITEEDTLAYKVTGTHETDFTIVQNGNSYNNLLNRINTEFILAYNQTFNQHTFSGSLVYHADKFVQAGTQVPLLTRGLMGRFQYNYLNRYFAETGLAYSGMSPYSPDRNMGFFPSLSFGWIASNEKALLDSKTVDFLKFRASIGMVGMSDLSTANNYFMYQQYYRNGSTTPYFGTNGTSKLSTLYEYYIANDKASWEKSLKTNFGAEIHLFGNRLTTVADVFFERRYDILTQVNVPSYFGILADANFNAGIIHNKGFEFNLKWKDNINGFTYYLNPNIAFARNKIIELNEAPVAYDYMEKTGTRVGAYYCLEADGLFSSWEEINNPSTPKYMYGDVQPGDIKYIDQNGDGFIDDNDMLFINDRYQSIPEINFGIMIGGEYRGFDLSLYGYGMAHRTLNIRTNSNGAYVDGIGNLSMMAWNDRWAYYPELGIDTRAEASYPRLSIGSNANNWRNSTFWLRNGDFFRISNLTLGYTIPAVYTNSWNTDKIRIYFTATNPFLFDRLDGEDAEGRMDDYPMMRTFKIGLNLNF